MKSMLQNDPDRMAMISGGNESLSEAQLRLNAAINTEVTKAKKFGDKYFNAGADEGLIGAITGRFSRGVLESSGKGLKAYTEMQKINNDLEAGFTDKELVDMLNKGYKDAELSYRFELPKDDREKKAEGELVGGQKKLDKNNDGDITAEDLAMLREGKQEGGMMMDEQMEMLMEEQQVPDDEMEEDYLDFIINEALTPEEEDFLVEQLKDNDKLSEIFDKVIEVASEFTGSGPVEGPGTGVSDSIPARLSDGEFVFTAKATEQIGVDKLMSMMKEAEAAADERREMQEGGVLSETTTTTRRFADPTQMEDEEEVMQDEKTIQDMRGTNPRMQ